MFRLGSCVFLFAVVSLTAYQTAPAPACGDYDQFDPEVVAVAGKIERGIVRDGHFYAVSSKGQLIDVDLKKRQARNLGDFGLKLTPLLDVADGKVCVTTDRQVAVINLKTGKVEKAAPQVRAACGVSLLSGEHVAVAEEASVESADMVWGTRRTLVQLDKDEQPAAHNVTMQHAGQTLYVADARNGTVSVFDLKTGKEGERIELASEGFDSACVVGDKAFVAHQRQGWGRKTPRFEIVELKTGKRKALEVPSDVSALGRRWNEKIEDKRINLVASADGTVLLSGKEKVYQYDAEGKLIGVLALKDRGQVVGGWDGQVLLASDSALRLVKLEKPAAKQ